MKDNMPKMPLRLYRSAEDITRDIAEVRGRIEEIRSSFSIRELLIGMLSEPTARGSDEWIYDLQALIGEADTARRRMRGLCEELEFLEAELGEAKCSIRF